MQLQSPLIAGGILVQSSRFWMRALETRDKIQDFNVRDPTIPLETAAPCRLLQNEDHLQS